MKTTIALIIPIYNAGEFLKPCLDSVARQTIPPDEVILIDDASDDGNQMYILDYANKHKWVYWRNSDNVGPAASRNIGIRYSKSNYFTFLDADDELMPDALEKMKKAIAWRPNATMLQFNHVRHYLAKNKTITKVNLTAKRDIRQLDIDKKPYCKYWYGVWNKCFKRGDNPIMFKDGLRYGEDALFVIERLLNNEYIHTINDTTVKHNLGKKDSLIRTKTYRDIQKFYNAYRDLLFKDSCDNWVKIKAIVTLMEQLVTTYGL